MISKILSLFGISRKEVREDGPFELHYKNSQLKRKGTYKDGEYDGPYESYHEMDSWNLKAFIKTA